MVRKEKQKVVDTALCHNALCGCCSCSDKCDQFDPQVDASKEAESALIVIITFSTSYFARAINEL